MRLRVCVHFIFLEPFPGVSVRQRAAESHGDVFVYRTVDMNGSKGMNDSEWLHRDE